MADIEALPRCDRFPWPGQAGRARLGAAAIIAAALAFSTPLPAFAETESFVDGLAAFDAGDVTETIRIWSALADGGDAAAQVGLAGLHLAGSGVRRNPSEAARLYRLAAEQGDMNGQLNLGRLYWQGIGVEQDPAQAYGWLRLAGAQGRRWAQEKSLEIEASLSSAERTEADALIKAFTAR
ncbi:MAG: tetratricopeptide repeat protein [Geminicoccaceae bacterium]